MKGQLWRAGRLGRGRVDEQRCHAAAGLRLRPQLARRSRSRSHRLRRLRRLRTLCRLRCLVRDLVDKHARVARPRLVHADGLRVAHEVEDRRELSVRQLRPRVGGGASAWRVGL